MLSAVSIHQKSILKSCFAIHNPLPLSYPVVFLVGSLLTTALLGLGLVSFHEEHDLTKVEQCMVTLIAHTNTAIPQLWVPVGSKLRNNVEWVQENFPQQLRFNQVIFKSENVLSPEVLQDMYNLTMRMRQVTIVVIGYSHI